MLVVLMKPFEADPPKVPMLSKIYLVGRQREVNGVHGLCELGWLWAHGATSMRENHIDCQARKNENKKLGCKRPDLRMGESLLLLLFYFLGMPELKSKPDWLGTLLL